MRLRGDDRGALGVHWMVKLGAALAVFGVLGYDGFVCIATHLKATDDAGNAAYAASQYWNEMPGGSADITKVYQAAADYEAANNPSDHVCAGDTDPICHGKGAFSVDPDGTVHLVVFREAKTLVFNHLGFTRGWRMAYGNGDASLTR